jgi:hypothetical protein
MNVSPPISRHIDRLFQSTNMISFYPAYNFFQHRPLILYFCLFLSTHLIHYSSNSQQSYYIMNILLIPGVLGLVGTVKVSKGKSENDTHYDDFIEFSFCLPFFFIFIFIRCDDIEGKLLGEILGSLRVGILPFNKREFETAVSINWRNCLEFI